MVPPKVFVSYSHEDADHDAWVLDLAALLRKNGVEASLDQWDLRPGQDTTLFMESQIRDSDFVVLVCTPTYANKSNISRGGVGYEKNIISAEMLQSQDLKPKFIPVLRKSDFQTSIPTYLGSKYGIDFRSTRNQEEALQELLKAIHEIPPASKPPIGPSPFLSLPSGPALDPAPAAAQPNFPTETTTGEMRVDGHVESWEKRALGRFEFLRQSRIDKKQGDPFAKGYWQASFALQGRLRAVGLVDLLDVLRKSKTGRTGWDIGWVPTREGIAPYPFQDGIEVWLAESGGKESGHSDFWRAEPIGTFSLFRGYQENEADFSRQYPHIQLDFSLVLWRVTEFLLYIESFAQNISAEKTCANLRIRWTGLENRQLGNHKALAIPADRCVSHQPSVVSSLHISNTTAIRKTLLNDLIAITRPLFEVFDFFTISKHEATQLIKGVFDVEKESGI